MKYLPPRALALLLALTLACGGSDSPTGGGTGGNISLESSKAVSDSVGPAGGTLTAHAGNGVTYTLTIPAGALLVAEKITLTPIASQKNLPVSGGFAAGVDLQPAGLHFARAAQLAIAPAPAPPAGMVAAAVSFEGDGDSLGLTPLLAGQGGLITQVTHFSGVSVIFGTTADLNILATQIQTGVASQSFLNQLAALGIPSPPGNPAALPILQQWFSTVILPELQGAGTDAELLLGVGDYDTWAQQAAAFLTGAFSPTQGVTPPSVPAALAPEVGAAAAAAAPVLRQAITGNNSVCLTRHNLQALVNVLFWQGYAQYFKVATPAEQLDVPSLLPGLCAQFVAESIGLVDPLPVGQTVSFDQVWAVSIGGSPPALPADFQVTVSTGSPINISTPVGFTGPDPQGGPIQRGFYTTVVTAQQAGTMDLQIQACLVSPFSDLTAPFASGFCGSTSVTRTVQGGNCGATVGTTRIVGSTDLAAFQDVAVVDGSLILATDGTVHQVTLPCLRYVKDGIAINGQALVSADFPALDSALVISVSFSPALVSLSAPALKFLGDRQGGRNGGLGISNDSSLSTINIPGVKILSFSDLGTSGNGAGLILGQPLPSLTSLSGLGSGMISDSLFFTLDTLGTSSFSEAEVLAFANRGTFKGVCQLIGTGQTRHCYQGPPWH